VECDHKAIAHSQNNPATVPECKLQLASECSLKAALPIEPLADELIKLQ
jgi:hypothetical protein